MAEQAVFLSADEFRQALRVSDLDTIVNEHVLRGTPHVFRDAPEAYERFRNELGSLLGITGSSFRIVGSGRTGFSLAESKFGKPFDENSDIDVLVVSARLFDELWLDLLQFTRRQASALSPQIRQHLNTHRESRIFHGRALPHNLSGVARITGRWFRTFRRVGRKVKEVAPYEVKGMLFRTWDHARFYYRNGLWTLIQQNSTEEK